MAAALVEDLSTTLDYEIIYVVRSVALLEPSTTATDPLAGELDWAVLHTPGSPSGAAPMRCCRDRGARTGLR